MLLRLVRDFRRAMDLSLVLDQEGIPHELRGAGEEQWALRIDDVDAPRAEAALAAFERENPLQRPRPERPTVPASAVACGLVFFLSLLAFLGTSKRADLAGHLCGFAAGVVLGATVSRLPALRSPAAQGALAVVAAAIPAVAWLAAFR